MSATDVVIRGALSRSAGAGVALSTLIFHRVLPAPDPMFPDEWDATRFDATCGWIAAWFQVLPLDEAVARLARGSLPDRAMAITFDDGYADNHDVALPILQRHKLTATFFVAQGFLDGGRMWNDTIVEAIRRCTQPALECADLGMKGIATLALDSLGARRAAIERLLSATKYLGPAQRQRAADAIAERGGATLPNDLMMSSLQLRGLTAAGMQIGGHTISHPILKQLDETAARAEIEGGKKRLEDTLGVPVSLFAYPNGKQGSDYTARDVDLVRRAGFTAAMTTEPGVSRTGADRFEMRRFTPWDRSGWRFGLRLARNLRR